MLTKKMGDFAPVIRNLLWDWGLRRKNFCEKQFTAIAG
jgi:hypothetical protein